MGENRTIGGIDIHHMTGEVVGADKSSTMQVHGGGGGGTGHIVGGHGYTATNPVSVTSSTTIHDQIFLRDANGKERAFQLSNFNVACREGHKLSVLWAKKKGKERGPFFRVINHTTGDSISNKKGLVNLLKPHWVLLPISFVVAYWLIMKIPLSNFEKLGMYLGGIVLVPLIVELVRTAIGHIRANSLLRHGSLLKILNSLEP